MADYINSKFTSKEQIIKVDNFSNEVKLSTFELDMKTPSILPDDPIGSRDANTGFFRFDAVLDAAGNLIAANWNDLQPHGIKSNQGFGQPFWKAEWWSGYPDTIGELRAAITKAAAGLSTSGNGLFKTAGSGKPSIPFEFHLKPVQTNENLETTLLIFEGHEVLTYNFNDKALETSSTEHLKQEILKYQQMEKALFEREARLRKVINTAPIVLIALNRDGIYTFSEGKTLEKVGRKPGEEVGESIYDLYSSNVEMLKAVDKAFKGETVKLLMDLKDVFLEASYLPELNSQGEVVGVIGIANDVTDLKRTEFELRASDYQLKHLLLQQAAISELSQHALSIKDLPDLINEAAEVVARTLEVEIGVITEFNPEKVEFTVQVAKELRGGEQETGEFNGASLALSYYTHLQGEPVLVEAWETETRFNTGDEKPCYITSSLATIIQNEENPFGILIAHSLSGKRFIQEEVNFLQAVANVLASAFARHKAEDEIQKALVKEKELNELKSRFVSMTSHEFRTPLSVILSSVELLQHYENKWSSEKKSAIFVRIKQAIKNMTGLLEDVLTFSKAEADKSEYNPEVLDLSNFCLKMVEEFQLSDQNDHTIQFSPQLQSETALVDPKMLRHILGNLLSNALKYSPGGTVVFLNLYEDTDVFRFSVSDQGRGIPQEDLPYLFNSFQRARNVGNTPGTGLGLAIVKQYLDLHRGKIEVTSEIDNGSTFTFTIPKIVLLKIEASSVN